MASVTGTLSGSNFSPPYADVFASNIQIMNDEQKIGLLTTPWKEAHCFSFPTRFNGGKLRKAQGSWFMTHTWLRYSPSTDGVFCGPCFLFGGQVARSSAMIREPFTDWCNFAKIVKRHTKDQCHIDQLIASENYLAVMKGHKKDIECTLVSQFKTLVEKNRQILTSIVKTIILCGKQNIALRGHDDSLSNFQSLLHFQAEHNELLKDHLTNGDPRTRYTSPKIQNELIAICGQIISGDIVARCNKAGVFGFMADEATDAATMEQMAMCVRFVDPVSDEVCEELLGFSECESTTGEALANAFMENLTALGIRTEQMRGQGYDGASNMSGIHRGVQARIRALVPEAIYTHCKAHCLNLAVIHACKEVYVRNLMTTVQQVAFAFNYSAKRLLQFQETLAADDVSREAMQERTRLRSLCETRWSARADALHTFLAAYRTVVTSLDTLAAGGDTKAAVYKLSVLSFEFVISLVATEHLLSALVPLSNMLQAKDCDLLHAANDARVVMVLLQAERNDDDVWDSLFQKATGIAADVDVVPTAPRQRGRQQNRPNAPGDVSQFWKRNMYLPFVDHLLAEIDTRLMQGHGRFSAQKLIPLKVQNDGLTREVIGEVFDAFRACLDVDVATFVRECERWNTLWTNLALAPDRPPAPSSLAESIAHASNALYPSIRQCLIILMVMPVSTATAERSFSVMRRVKTYLRSTMGTERMSGLGLMNVYREKEISAEHVVDVFANKQNRRLAFIFKV